MMWWYGTGMTGWGYALLAVGVLLFWGIVVLVGLALVRDRDDADDRRTPEQVLADRFARGEIDEAEYRDRLDVLHAGELAAPRH